MTREKALRLAIMHFEEQADIDREEAERLKERNEMVAAAGYDKSAAWHQSIADNLRGFLKNGDTQI